MVVPYQEPAEIYELVEPGSPPVPTGKRIVIINRNPGTEWTTELWRQGGYMDQQYLLYRSGQAPEQLRTAYMSRQIRKIGWSSASVLFIVDFIVFAAKYIQ